MRTTLAQVKASRIADVLNMDSSEARFLNIINEAQQRLLARGKWWGTVQRIKIAAYSGSISWPRTVAVPEAVIMDDYQVPLHDFWFEYLENGPGLQDDATACLKLVDREHGCTFNDVTGDGHLLRLYSIAADDGLTVRLQGEDENGNVIRSTDGSEGEVVTLAQPYVETTNYYTVLTGVQKAVTSGVVRLYQVTSATELLALGYYDPTETVPWYRRSRIVGLEEYLANLDEDYVTVTAQVKLEYAPAVHDTDYMLIGNIPALKAMAMAIQREENAEWDNAKKYELQAVQILDDELAHYRGDGALPSIRVQDRTLFGGGGIESAS